MGCFNQYCFLSGKLIKKNEPAVVIVLQPAKYAPEHFEALTLPIEGKYDEYGCVELKSLKDISVTVDIVNKALKGKTNRFKTKYSPVKTQETPNYFWGAVFDYETPVLYIAGTFYHNLVNEFISASEQKEVLKELEDLRKQFVSTEDSIKKSKGEALVLAKKFAKLYDSPFMVTHQKIGLLFARESTYIKFTAFKAYVMNSQDQDILKFYALCKVLSSLGKSLTPAGYGTQETNLKLVKQFHEFILKQVK